MQIHHEGHEGKTKGLPQRHKEQPVFTTERTKNTENSRFHHEVHEGNEDNTLSQCILSGRPA